LDEKEALVFIATRDDKGFQVCSLNSDGVMTALHHMDIGFSVYNGMTIEKIDDRWFLFAGGYDQKVIKAYAISIYPTK